jgi:hypothetical protein
MKSEVLIGLAAFAVIACGGHSDATPVPDTTLPIVAAPTPTDTVCSRTGLWTLCSVYYRLERSGLTVRKDSARQVKEDALAIGGVELPIARGTIRIFLYADSLSRLRDEAKLDKTKFVTPAQEPGISRQRTLVHNANLLVLMDVLNGANRERIANALMAGMPQLKKPPL